MGGVHVPHLVLHVSDLHNNCHHHCRARDGLVFRSSLSNASGIIWRTPGWSFSEMQLAQDCVCLCMFAFWNSRGDDSAVPAVFGVDDLCPERPENRNFAQTRPEIPSNYTIATHCQPTQHCQPIMRGVISSRTCHVTYFWSLWQSWICGFMMQSFRVFVQVQAGWTDWTDDFLQARHEQIEIAK